MCQNGFVTEYEWQVGHELEKYGATKLIECERTKRCRDITHTPHLLVRCDRFIKRVGKIRASE
jgi:hypothetical protein